MFVRFRAVRHRLVVDLVEARRERGKVKSEHIARLGSAALPEPVALGERIRFWRELKERFRDIAQRLANRVSSDDRRKALAAVHKRIPKPSEDERKQARQAAIESNLRWWQRHLEMSEEQASAHRALKVAVEERVEVWTGQAEMARANVVAAEAARDDPDKPAPMELTYKEATRIVREAGVTKQMGYRAIKMAEMSEEEVEARLARRRRRRRR